MKHVSQILENTFYKDQAERDKFTNSKGMLGRAFYFSFVAMLGLYNAAEDRSYLMRYFKQDKKLKIDDIGDENNNMSLIIKLLDEQGAFKSKTTVNQITRFLVKLKQGQIDYVDKDIVLGWIAKMDRKKFMGTIGKFSKSITKLLKDKDYKLEHFALDAVDFAKRSKQAAPEFYEVAKRTKLKTDFDAPTPTQAPTVGDLIKKKLDDKKAAGDKPKRGRKLKIDSGDTKDGVPFTHDGLLDLVKKYVDSGFSDKLLGNNSPSLYISGRTEFPADIPHAEILDIAMRDAIKNIDNSAAKAKKLFEYLLKFRAVKDKKDNILYRMLKVDNGTTRAIKLKMINAIRWSVTDGAAYVDLSTYKSDLDQLYAAEVMEYYGFYDLIKELRELTYYSPEVMLGGLLQDNDKIHKLMVDRPSELHGLLVFANKHASTAFEAIKREIVDKKYAEAVDLSTPRAVLDILKLIGVKFEFDEQMFIDSFYSAVNSVIQSYDISTRTRNVMKEAIVVVDANGTQDDVVKFVDTLLSDSTITKYVNKYGESIALKLMHISFPAQFNTQFMRDHKSNIEKYIINNISVFEDMNKAHSIMKQLGVEKYPYPASSVVNDYVTLLNDNNKVLSSKETINYILITSDYKYLSYMYKVNQQRPASSSELMLFIDMLQKKDKELFIGMSDITSYISRAVGEPGNPWSKARIVFKPHLKELIKKAETSRIAKVILDKVYITLDTFKDISDDEIYDKYSDFNDNVKRLNVNDPEDKAILRTVLGTVIGPYIKDQSVSDISIRQITVANVLENITTAIDDSDDIDSVYDTFKDMLGEMDLTDPAIKERVANTLQYELVRCNDNRTLLACAELCGEIDPDNDLFDEDMSRYNINDKYRNLIMYGKLTQMDSEETEKFLDLYHNGNHIIHNIFDPKFIKQIKTREVKEKSKLVMSNIVLDNLESHGDIMDEMYEQLDAYYRNHIRRVIVGKSAVEKAINSGPIEMFSKLNRQQLKSAFAYNDINLDEIDKKIKVTRKSKKITFSEWVKAVEQDVAQSKEEVVPDPKVEEIVQTKQELNQLTVNFQKKYWANKHGSNKFRILKRFNVNLPSKDFYATKEEMQRNGTLEQVVPCFHGTGGISASFILRYGFSVQSKSNAIGITGRMLGDGIYFAPSIDKPLQYIGNNGYSRGVGGKGYILRMESLLGKKMRHYQTDWDNDGKPLPGYEAAGISGSDGIRSAEYAVRNADKQLRIVEAWEVEIITDNHFRNIARETPVNEEHDYMFGINEFIEEEANIDYVGFQFHDDLVPTSPATSSKVCDVVTFKEAAKLKGIQVEQNANGTLVKFPTNKDTVIHDVLDARLMDGDVADIYWSLFPQT